jgi:integrase
MASLIKRGTKYYLDFYDATRTPKRKRVALRVSTKREAEKLKAKLEYEYAMGESDPWCPAPSEPAPPPEPEPEPEAPFETAAEAAEAFYESRAHRTKSTRRTYRDIVGRFVASLPHDRAIAAVTAGDIERWLDSTPASDVTRRTYTKHLSTYFRYCIEQGVLAADPTDGVRLRRVPKRFPKALTEAEVARLVRTIEEGPASVRWLRDVVVFAVHTGLRRGELVSLRWRAVDLGASVVTVACDGDFQTKSGAERKVPLAARAQRVLDRVAKGRETCGRTPVFQHSRGAINPDYLSQRFALYARKAGLDGVGVHGLRHTAITRLIERGVPVPIVQRFAGHADIATTMRYCSIADDVYAEQIQKALG